MSCSESVEPGQSRAVPLPRFSFSASGTALNQVIGTLDESGTRLGKGFDNGNPHVGDAIVATFVYLSSATTNIITSVHDNLNDANFTPVGNPYTLVEFNHAGGISMATYVATGVQGFADPAPSGGPHLAVFADLSEPVTDGGVLLTTYGGVEDVFAQALGGHHSASGSGTGSITVNPGPISVNAGAVVYTASLVPVAGLGGRALPGNFGYITTISNNDVVHDIGYFVAASAGAVDASWSYTFNSPSNALATVISLNAAGGAPPPPPPPPPPPTTGDLVVNTTSSGSAIPASYTVNVGSQSQTVASTGSVTFSNLTATSYTVVLFVPANCTVTGGASQTVTVPAGGTATASFAVTCATAPGDLVVTTSSSGANIPASYTVTVDGQQSQAVASSGSVTFTNLSAGNHNTLLSVPSNCTVWGDAARFITVPSGGTATIAYSVNCNAPPVVNAGPNQTAVTGLLYSLNWSFSDANHNGPWTYTINWGDGSTSSGTVSSEGSFSNGHTYVILLPRSFTVTVTVKDAAGASSSSSKKVSVLLL